MSDPTARITPIDISLLITRLVLGFVFILHGSQKLFMWFGGKGMEQFTKNLEEMNVPMPQVSAYLAAIAEFGGGILIALGLLTRLATIPMIFTMGVAFVTAHGGRLWGDNNGEYAFVLGVLLIALLISGPGKLSLTGVIKCRGCRPRANGAG